MLCIRSDGFLQGRSMTPLAMIIKPGKIFPQIQMALPTNGTGSMYVATTRRSGARRTRTSPSPNTRTLMAPSKNTFTSPYHCQLSNACRRYTCGDGSDSEIHAKPTPCYGDVITVCVSPVSASCIVSLVDSGHIHKVPMNHHSNSVLSCV